ncbi:MAG: glutathione S-transferase family protein [Pseudomonadota bacterium]
MLTVYGRANSSNVQAVLWGVEEMRVPYQRLDYGEGYGGLDTPEFGAMNPHRRIPVVTVDGVALWESGAILRYLAGQHGAPPFWPSDPLARAQVDMWAEWAKISCAGAFTVPVFWEKVRKKPEHQNAQVIAANVAALEAQLAKAGAQLASHAYLAGPDFTLADIALGHILYRYFDMDIARADLPALRAYYDRLCQRPAYAATVMISYDTLRGTF